MAWDHTDGSSIGRTLNIGFAPFVFSVQAVSAQVAAERPCFAEHR